MKYVYGKRIKTLRERLTAFVASLAILANSVGVALPFLLTQKAAAVSPSANTVTEASKTTTSATLVFEVTEGDSGGTACFEAQADAASPVLPPNQQTICLPIGSYPITFENLVSYVEVREVLLDGSYTDWQRFFVLSIVPCTATTTVHTTSLAAWDRSETRATGHNELVADGLHIWTEGATSTDKAAGYYATDFALSGLGDQSIADALDYEASFGITPGLQLVTDFNNDGTSDGILVGEAVYGNDWWLTNSAAQFVKDNAPNNGGGSGSAWFGTPAEWLAEFPDARVKAIGYSLGSGVHGDGVIKRISLGCTNYTFGLDTTNPSFAILQPANGSSVSGVITVQAEVTDESGITKLLMNIAGQSHSWTNGASSTITKTGNIFSVTLDTTTLPDGPVHVVLRGTDGAGNTRYWNNNANNRQHVFYVDNTAPNAPNNLRLQVRSTSNFVGNNGWTNKSDVTALWNSNNSEPVTYEYQYWNDVPTSPYHSGNRWTNPVNSEQYAGTVNQGDGKHYFCVVAIDAAGNRSACSTPFAFNYDSSSPVTSINVSPVVNGIFTVSGNASDNLNLNRVYVQLVSRVSGARCGGTTINLIPEGAASDWSVTYDIATLMSVSATPVPCPEGLYAAHVAVVDMAGNTSSAGWTENFMVAAPAAGSVDDGEVQGAEDCDGDGITDPNGCDNGNGSRSPADKALDRAQGGQVLAATDDNLTNTGTQNGGIIALIATGLSVVALATLRRKQENQ